MDKKKQRTQPNRKKAILYIALAWVFFTLVIALSKKASAQSSVSTVLLFQNFIGLFIVLPWMIRGGKQSLYLSKIGVILIRSLAGYLSYAFMFLAVQKISLVNTVLLSNSSPLFIPPIIWLWRKIKLPWRLWLGMIIGFLGIAFILGPTGEIINTGALFALGAAICLAITAIAKRRLVKTESIVTILFYYFLISTLISIPFTIDSWKMIDKNLFLLLGLIGILFTCGQTLFLSALRYEKPSFLSFFNYSSVIYGVIIQWIVWGNWPDWQTMLGIIVVCTGGILTISHGKEIVSDTRPPRREK